MIVEEDLTDALQQKLIVAAGIDVLEKEPPKKLSLLHKLENCFITPHIAWATSEARGRLLDIAIANLAAFLDGRPQNLVN